MTTGDRELLIRALGTDEPPMRLDLDALEARGHARRRTRALTAVTAAVAGVAAVSGGVTVLGGHSAVDAAAPGSLLAPTNREIGYCYRSADITSSAPNQHVGIGIGGRNGPVDVTGDIMQICSDNWKSNRLDYQPRQPGVTDYPVPPLVACVLNAHAVTAAEGAVGVFPGDASTCAELGLPVAQL
ncbi:hypothetical protein [Amycolatopsis sp. NPDC051372]|uniref:hypothetical protein n=1 Tax=unclassified Amycolatopsis TaxID=2618356 RepID=UPI00342ADD8F